MLEVLDQGIRALSPRLCSRQKHLLTLSTLNLGNGIMVCEAHAGFVHINRVQIFFGGCPLVSLSEGFQQ